MEEPNSDNLGAIASCVEPTSINSAEHTPLLSQRRLVRSLSGAPSESIESEPDVAINMDTANTHSGDRDYWSNLRDFFHYEEQPHVPLNKQDSSKHQRTVGTIAGVFSPVTLSMFSALVFLRVGYIVGHAGLLETLLQFAIAYILLIFTVMSVCAISTNGAVEGGGCYFMISRLLGPEFGGSIGTIFCLANIVSSALLLSGCAEGLLENFGPHGYLIDGALPDGRWWRFLLASVVNLINIGVCLIGAAAFARMSAFILAVVVVCLSVVIVSYMAQPPMDVPIPLANQLVQNETYLVNGTFTGLSSATLSSNLWASYGRDYTSAEGTLASFATVFGVLFSGVTGIMAGANMSGELKDPSKSIPRGTLSAIGFTCVIYILLSLLTAASCSTFLLQNNYVFMMGICVWKPFVTVGIITATWSASLTNLIGSSRVLAALAKDDIFGFLLKLVAKGVTAKGNPWCSVIVVGLLVEFCLLMGSLNVIAQLNSVLFLLSYCASNLACLMPELSSAPNFRPTFRFFSWHTALLGFLGTMVMMFVINAVYASVSLLLCLILIIALHLLSPARTANWGSISQAIIFHQVRKYLLLLDSRKDHVKFWRPQILLMVSNPRTAVPLISFVNALKKSGLYVLGHIKMGSTTDPLVDPTSAEYAAWLDLAENLKIKSFVEITVSPSVREGMHHLIRLSGLGAMKPNTIVMGFYDEQQPIDLLTSDPSLRKTGKTTHLEADRSLYPVRRRGTVERPMSSEEYVAIIKDIVRLQKNVVLCRNFHTLDLSTIQSNRKSMFIDVWPMNLFRRNATDEFDTSTLFQLQLACILHMVPPWKDLELRVFLCAWPDDSDTHNRQMRLRQSLKQLRIDAKVAVATWAASDSVPPDSESQNDAEYAARINRLLLQNSASTAVMFLYLPLPTETSGSEYLTAVSTLTDNLPPTVLVHGISPVTSTNL